MKKILIAILATAFVFSSTGCYGSFTLTKKIYKVNGSLGNKWINSIVFFLIGGPVYGATTFIDALVLNSVEFWTGANPLASNTLEQTDEHGNKLVATKLPGGALDLTMIGVDGSVKTMTLINNGESISAYNESGKVVAQFKTVEEVQAE